MPDSETGMRAFQVEKFGSPLLERKVEKPRPTGYQLLVRTDVTGVCHTDVHVAQGDWEGNQTQLPRTPGHEGVGFVEAVGSSVQGVKIGDRVGVSWLNSSCMECRYCKKGRENVCQSQIQTGFTQDGSFAEFFICDSRFAIKIPDSIKSVDAAPVLCAGVTAYKALRAAKIEPGSRIAIAGAAGGLGHLAIQYAKAMGYEVVALDFMTSERVNIVKELGADFAVGLQESGSLVDQLEKLQPHRPVEASVVFAPSVQAVTDAVDYVCPGGTIVVVCLPSGSFQINPVKLVLKELTLVGSIVGTPEHLREAFDYVAQGKVKLHVTEQPLGSVNEVLSALKEGTTKGRVVLRVGPS